MGGITGGIRNVAINWDNIDNFGEGFAYFNIGGLAGSSGAFLADMGVEGPGIGMACNWMLRTGNALIEGASGSEVMEAGTQGALWGSASGFAVMGLNAAFNELMNIPWATNYHVPSRNNYHEVNLGDWLFGTQSANISEIIATQGTAGATVILAASTLSTKIDIFNYGEVPYDYGRGGAEFSFGITGDYSQYNFIQTVYASDYEDPYFLDGGMGDMGRGFWRHPDIVDRFVGYKWGFQDRPLHGLDENTIWRAELTVVGRYGNQWYPISTISWGFNINYGNVSLMPLRLVKNPSQFHQNWIRRACNAHSLNNL